MNKRILLIVATSLIALSIAVVYSHRTAAPIITDSKAQPSAVKSRTMNAPETDVHLEKAAKSPSSSVDYSAAFTTADNYWKLAHDLLPAAKDGNADAAFFLYKAMEQCASDNKMYFKRRGQSLMLDQGIVWAGQRHLSTDMARLVYSRCHDFLDGNDSELGNALDWLAQATASGQPLAQTTTALKLFTQQLLKNIRLGNAAANANPEQVDNIDSKLTARQLLRLAVESKNPQVLFDIGDAQGYLSPPGTDPTANLFAWRLVACQRGFDCTANSEWIRIACVDDARCASFTDPNDFVRTMAGDKWSEVEQLAQEISDKLDAGKWDELGLGS